MQCGRRRPKRAASGGPLGPCKSPPPTQPVGRPAAHASKCSSPSATACDACRSDPVEALRGCRLTREDRRTWRRWKEGRQEGRKEQKRKIGSVARHKQTNGERPQRLLKGERRQRGNKCIGSAALCQCCYCKYYFNITDHPCVVLLTSHQKKHYDKNY